MFLNYLEHMKQGNMKVSYKEAFDIIEEAVVIDLKYDIPDPEALRICRIKEFDLSPDEELMTEISTKYRMKKLKNPLVTVL